MKLYNYFRSSASYRVRIALHLKELAYETQQIHLVNNGGEQHAAWYAECNPQELVPVLEHDGQRLVQSMAIIEYLDEAFPERHLLLPGDAAGRARIRGLAQVIACEVHPLNNLSVLQYLERTVGVDAATKTAWYQHWVQKGLQAMETLLARDARTGDFCHGDTPTLADCCLVPQLYNARRFHCDLTDYPTLTRIDARCQSLDAFRLAAPGEPT